MFRDRRYRYDHEQLVLTLTILLVLGVIVVTSTATFCLSGIFIIVMFVMSAVLIRSHHESLMREAVEIERGRLPELAAVVNECGLKLQPGFVESYLANKNELNAYTFGVTNPKVLVLYAPLLKVMNRGELMFIIGHEMGHVALGHTWLNTIVGGLAGIPAPFGAAVLLYAAFRWWNRLCEFSADRAGLLACGDLNLAISALVKLVAPDVRSQREFDQAYAMIDAEDDEASYRLVEAFQSHPMLIRRINKLRDYARTAEYQHLQAGVNQNIAHTAQPAARITPEVSLHDQTSATTPTPDPPKPPEERWPWLKPRE